MEVGCNIDEDVILVLPAVYDQLSNFASTT